MSDSRAPYRNRNFRGEDRGRKPYGEKPHGPPLPTPAISFYDPSGKLWPDLFDAKAAEWAKRFNGINAAQIKTLLDELKRYDTLANDENWHEIVPLVKMIRAKTAYRAARQKKDTPALSAQWGAVSDCIAKGLAETKTRKDLRIFRLFFEAIFGLYYGNSVHAR